MRSLRLLCCAAASVLVSAANAQPPALPDLPDEPSPPKTPHPAGASEQAAPQIAPVSEPDVTITKGVGEPVLRRCCSLDRLKQSFDIVIGFAFINTKEGLKSPPDEKTRSTIRARVNCEAHAFPAGIRAKAEIESISIDPPSGNAAAKAAFQTIAAKIKDRSITILRHDNGELEAAFDTAEGMTSDERTVLRFLTDAMIVSMPRLPRSPIGPAASWDVRTKRGVLGYTTDLSAHSTLVNWFDGGRLFVETKSDESAEGDGTQGQHVEVSRHVAGHSTFFPSDILPREARQTISTRLLDPSTAGPETPVHQEWLTTSITLSNDEPPPEIGPLTLHLQDLFLGSTLESPGVSGKDISFAVPALTLDGEGESPDDAGTDLRWNPSDATAVYDFTWHKEKRNEFAGGLPVRWDLGDDWRATLKVSSQAGNGSSIVTATIESSTLNERILPKGAAVRFSLDQSGLVSEARFSDIERWQTGGVRAMRIIAQTLTHCYAQVGPLKYDADARWARSAQATLSGFPCSLTRQDQVLTSVKDGRRVVKSTSAARVAGSTASVAELDNGQLHLTSLSGVTRGEATFAIGSLLPASAWFFQEDDCRGEASATTDFGGDARVSWPVSYETLAKIELKQKQPAK